MQLTVDDLYNGTIQKCHTNIAKNRRDASSFFD